MKRNIKLKTKGLTEEENSEIYNFFRKLRRKRKIKNKKDLSYELKMGEKKCATRQMSYAQLRIPKMGGSSLREE